MRESLFVKYLEKGFREIVEKAQRELKKQEYLFKELFHTKYQWDFTFKSLQDKRLILSCDLVGLEGPLQKRISQGPSQDCIPKTQAKIRLKESELKELLQMESLGMQEGLLERIYSDIKESLKAFYDQIEYMCLQGISKGLYELKDHMDAQKSHRVMGGIPRENGFRTSQSWSDPFAKPLDDIERTLEAALKKGHNISRILMPFETFNLLRNNIQLKERYPGERSLKRINEYFSQDYGSSIEIKVIRSRMKISKPQGEISVDPWEGTKVAFLSHRYAGDLLHSELSIDSDNDGLMRTQRPQSYLSVSKFSRMDPLSEYTVAQGRILAVLKDPESIYHLNV